MLTVSSHSSHPGTGLEYYVKHKLPQDHHLQGQHFSQADIVITNITCADGRTTGAMWSLIATSTNTPSGKSIWPKALRVAMTAWIGWNSPLSLKR